MDSHRRAIIRRAAVTAVTISALAGTAIVGVTSATAQADEECRAYAPVAHPFVKIVAEDNKFDTDCLKAPADRGFRIYLQNKDADPHNISIYGTDPTKDKKAEQLFKGKAIKGPGQEEYAVDALPGGTYYFRDDKTPAMSGEIEIPTKKK